MVITQYLAQQEQEAVEAVEEVGEVGGMLMEMAMVVKMGIMVVMAVAQHAQ